VVEWGSIEVIVGGDSYGVPITPLFPFSLAGNPSAQIKSRTGVQIGSIRPDDPDVNLGSGHKGAWNGTTQNGDECIVHVWQTDR
jgi:hypothetical protein